MSKMRKRNEDRLSAFFKNLNVDLSMKDSPAAGRQRDRMRKRAEFYRPELEIAAQAAFCETNAIVGRLNRELQPCDLFDDMRDFITHVLTRHTKALYPDSLQECFSTSYILDNWAFGPGASNGNREAGTVKKIGQHMTSTEACENLVLLTRRYNPYFAAFDCRNGDSGVKRVPGSALLFVLKNEDSVRTIAKEPSGNMALQLAGEKYLRGTLSLLGIRLENQQSKNRSLARLGSIDGSLATIDLSKASDMFSKKLIELTWPREWFDFFMKVRSPVTALPSGDELKLEMMSTMGNGCTFPMMTLTLVALIYAVRRASGGPYRWIDMARTAVNGDDIIIPTAEYSRVTDAIERCGLIVNHEKSYHQGPFRESCGGDYYMGEDITPFYVKSLSQDSDVYVAINQVLRWGSRHKIACFTSLRYLMSLLDAGPFRVPMWMQPTAGIQTTDVSRKYEYLQAKAVHVTYKGHFAMPLACGGYLESDEDRARYQPRREAIRYRVRKAVLPNGYTDGWDPSYGTLGQAMFVQLMLALVA